MASLRFSFRQFSVNGGHSFNLLFADMRSQTITKKLYCLVLRDNRVFFKNGLPDAFLNQSLLIYSTSAEGIMTIGGIHKAIMLCVKSSER